MIDLLAGLLVLLFAWKGFRRGLASASMDLLGLFVGMVAAYFWVNPLGEWILSRQPNTGLLAYLAASACIFFAVFLVFQVPSWILGHRMRKRLAEGRASAISAWSGAVLNGAVGFSYVLGLLWVSMLWFEPVFGSEEDIPFRTPLQRMSGAAMSAVAGNLVPQKENDDGFWSGLAQAYSRDPGSATVHLKTFLNHPDVEAIFSGRDPNAPVWDGQVRTTYLKKLTQDQTFMAACTQLEMWPAQEEDAVREAILERHLREIQNQINRIQNMPRIRELLSDPEFLRLAQERKVGALLRDPRLVTLWQDLRSGETVSGEMSASQSTEMPSHADVPQEPNRGAGEQPKKMYRWRDKDGRIYLTDEPPPKDAQEL